MVASFNDEPHMIHAPLTYTRCVSFLLAMSLVVGGLTISTANAQFGGRRFQAENDSQPVEMQFSSPAYQQPQQELPTQAALIDIKEKISAPEYKQILGMENRWQSASAYLQTVDVPLKDVAFLISDQTRVPIRIDERALEDVGLSVDVPVTCALPRVAAETLMILMLRDLDLTYMIDTGGIVITTPEEAESNLQIRFYSAEDIFRDSHPDFDHLIETITSTVEPESWEELGGSGSIVPLRGGVIVSQTYLIHRKLEGLFTAIRKGHQLSTQNYESRMFSISAYADKENATAVKLRGIPTTAKIVDTPLERVIDKLSSQSQLAMFIDNRALEDVGLSTDTPVNVDVKNVSLYQMLNVMCESIDLTIRLEGEVVVITTPEEAERELDTRLFLVRDMVRYQRGTGIQNSKREVSVQFDDLIEAITTTVEPESWEELGGPGSISPFYYNDCLVVSQTHQVHYKMFEMLEQIRKSDPTLLHPPTPVRSPRPQPPAARQVAPVFGQTGSPATTIVPRAAMPDITVVTYSVSQDAALSIEKLQALTEQLKKAIAPESWDGDQIFADATHSGVFVRQRRDIQKEVAAFLAKHGISAPVDADEAIPAEPSPQDDFGQQGNSGGGGIF